MTSNLPLIRLSAINPFLLELRRRGADTTALLRSLGLPGDIPASTELFVSSLAIYEFVERSAELADDPYLGFQLGNQLDMHAWEPIALAANEARTVGELLTRFTLHALEHSSATRFYLRTDGERCTFGFERVVEPPILPGQNDAFYLGFISRMLIQGTQNAWDATQVLFRVADPDCIPQISAGLRIATGDNRGIKVTFPATWLLEPFERSTYQVSVTGKSLQHPPGSLVDSVRAALMPHMHDPDLTVAKAARICRYDRRRLSRELRSEGTTISKEIAKLRANKAEKDLAGTNRRVAEIAQTVGFTDATVFSRAFKNWTGKSPQEYRRTHRSPNR
jgi:AraC-like DNA-binding protein